MMIDRPNVETKAELDRFCEAIAICHPREIQGIARGLADREG